MSRQYELCIVLRQDTLKNIAEDIQKKVVEMVKAQGGKVLGHDQWQPRHLSYAIKHEKKGVYAFTQIQVDRIDISSLSTFLGHQEAILRHDIFRVEDDYDYDAFKKRVSANTNAAESYA